MRIVFFICIIFFSVASSEKKAQSYGMTKVPSGTLNRVKKEKVIRRIKITGFWIDSTVVSKKEFYRLMKREPNNVNDKNIFAEARRWSDAIKYCNARSIEAGLEPLYDEVTGKCNYSGHGFRLITEAEWEWALLLSRRKKILIGHVQEWCNDLYNKKYYKTCPEDNPMGPPAKREKDYYDRVVRGGRAEYGNKYSFDIDGVNVGFRCVLR